MKATRVVAIVCFGWRVFRRVVGWIAVGEAIGHDEIDHVVGGDALKVRARVERWFKTERNHRTAARTLDKQRILPGTQRRADLDVYKKISAALVNRNLRRAQLRIRRNYFGATKIGSAKEQPDRVDRMVGPP